MNIHTILEHLASVDPILGRAIDSQKGALAPIIKADSHYYLANLCRSVASQQLSVKAASTIWDRTHSVVSNWNNPVLIVNARDEELRTCGLSFQKISYVKNIAHAVLDGSLDIENLDTMDDRDVCITLTAIKGIGQWTSEMFLIFSLGRQDVFSAGDLGLRNAMAILYSMSSITPAEALQKSKLWAPYRSTASRILWKTLDNQA
jgi:DNA-3-methyladenine glycosylase II